MMRAMMRATLGTAALSFLLAVSVITGAVAQAGQEQRQTFGEWNTSCIGVGTSQQQCRVFQERMYIDEQSGEERPLIRTTIAQLGVQGELALEFVFPYVRSQRPLWLDLRQPLGLRVDQGELLRVPYYFCDPASCRAVLELTQVGVATLKRGLTAQITVITFQGGTLTIDAPLNGFTAAYRAAGLPE